MARTKLGTITLIRDNATGLVTQAIVNSDANLTDEQAQHIKDTIAAWMAGQTAPLIVNAAWDVRIL